MITMGANQNPRSTSKPSEQPPLPRTNVKHDLCQDSTVNFEISPCHGPDISHQIQISLVKF